MKIDWKKNVITTETAPQQWDTALVCDADSPIRIVNVIDARDAAVELPAQTIRVAAGMRAEVITVVTGSASLDVTAVLEGDNAHFEHTVVYLGDNADKMQIATFSRHASANTSAKMVVHGVASGRALINIVGNIFIEHGAKQTEAELEHEGMLMSRKSRISALPGFEIHSDDVRAVHSSAIHYIRPEQLFYLSTRGIDETTGRQMIINGFIEDTLQVCDDGVIRDELVKMAQAQLETMIQSAS